MEENLVRPIADGRITSIRFSLATDDEVCTSSISDCPISHPSQLTNPFLGLPLESGKCESCGTAEPGKCDGHFGYIQLPVPVYHPCHVSELKKLLDLICLKCLRMKKRKAKLSSANDKPSSSPCSYCPDIPQIFIHEDATSDGSVFLELRLHPRLNLYDGFWNFLDRYGYQYSEERNRPLLPSEVLEMLKRFPEDTRKTLAGKGYFTQDGYVLQKLPVPPNCLSVPDISDGTSIMSSDVSVSMLKKVLRQAENIKSSRSGPPNFDSHYVEANELQVTIAQYLNIRGTGKASQGINARFGTNKETNGSSTKAWLEKMRTLFISKGSGFSSRTVITGDAYRRVDEVGLPLEIAQKVTFEEKVTKHNREHLQKLVDNNMCLTYRDGGAMYSLREGSKGHTSLKVGQVIHRRVMDGDIVFINRQPSTHKHSLQALSVYVHNDHTVKINPLICSPLAADFDGDCIHVFYPQSPAAKAEVVELFSVEQQLLSSHSGTLNLQMANDALLSLKIMLKKFILDKATAQQLAMFLSSSLPLPFSLKTKSSGPRWTVLQVLQAALPPGFDCIGERYLITQSEILKADCDRDIVQSLLNEVVSSVFFEKGSKEALNVFNTLQPLLMEYLYLDGYSVSLEEFCVPKSVSQDLQKNIQTISPLLHQLRSTYNELVELQIENHLRTEKLPLVNFIRECFGLGNLIDVKSESSIDKVVQQIGFLGLQLADRGKFYSKTLAEDMTTFLLKKYGVDGNEYPSEAFGLIKSCFIQGLNPYEELIHSTSSREVLVRSSRGLTEPGTLFKNLMAILRDVVICYDGTVRNVCTNSVVQFEYGVEDGISVQKFYPAGEPVGVLAATAVSNNAYKAVLDSSSSSNSSWEQMKEILQCGVKFKDELSNRRVVLYLNDCGCGKKYCRENAACLVKNQLRRVSLKDIAVSFLIEYPNQQMSTESSVSNASLVGHIHLDKKLLKDMNQSMHEVLLKCQETIGSLRRKKKSNLGENLKRIFLSVSECCEFQPSSDSERSQNPCLRFSSMDTSAEFDKTTQFMANIVCPILLDTIVKGDSRVETANITWISPHMVSWVRNHRGTEHGELALEIVLRKGVVKRTGDAWRIVLDCCLPVIHSIDTRRSIPYAIKQVQELLGISCAFDQAVKRLSKSISKVAKGVLKEHLTLVANSMTCTGDLIGFNKAGYKALFRSLNIQVPFTEATLFMPRKCFERAAEKCHKDSLSGIVASCSWGKQVAVGTGSRFEILWNKKEMESNQDGAIDAYNFLQLVRMSTVGERLDTACLGEDIDDLGLEDGIMEPAFSPEHNSDYNKPIFDNDTDLQCKFEQLDTADEENANESIWKTNSSVVESGGPRGWKVDRNSEDAVTGMSKPSAWSAWGTDTIGKQASHSTKSSEEIPGDVWGAKKSQKLPSNSWGKPDDDSEKSGWVKNDEKAPWGKQNSDTTDSQKQPSNSWSNPIKESDISGGAKNDEKAPWSNHNWDTTKSQKQPSSSWGNPVKESDASGWDKNDEKSQWGQQNESHAQHTTKPAEELSSVGWKAIDSQKQHTSPWGKGVRDSDTSSFPKNDDNDRWGHQKEHQALPGSQEPADAWHKKPQELDTNQLNKNGEKSDLGQWKSSSFESSKSGWNIPQSQDPSDPSAKDVTQPNWGSSSAGGWNKNESYKKENQRDVQLTSRTWDNSKTEEQASKPESSHAWGSPYAGNQNEQGKRQSGNRGWGPPASGDWKFKNNRPAKSPGKPDDWNPSRISAAANKPRFDPYTPEEQTIFADVEPIMISIRKILQQPRNDGDRLSDEDQAFVLENVFNYHPAKEAKMGRGIDYVMVGAPINYPESRCFFIVSTDGERQDFSYRKCMEKFIEQKYPEMAATFMAKYFRKRQPRSGGSQEQGWRGASPRPGASQDQGWGGGASPFPVGSQEQGWRGASLRPGASQDQGWGGASPFPGGSQDQGWRGDSPLPGGNQDPGWRGASPQPGGSQEEK